MRYKIESATKHFVTKGCSWVDCYLINHEPITKSCETAKHDNKHETGVYIGDKTTVLSDSPNEDTVWVMKSAHQVREVNRFKAVHLYP